MNPKLKRAVAIIALILILVFTVSFIMYLIDKDMFNGAIGSLAMWSGGFGLLFTVVLWISRSFPYQEEKDKERERLYKEAQEADERERAEQESGDNVTEQAQDESQDEAQLQDKDK